MEKLFLEQHINYDAILQYLEGELDLRVKTNRIPPGEMAISGISDARHGGVGCLVFADRATSIDYQRLDGCFVITDEVGNNDPGNMICAVADPRAAFIDVVNWLLRTNSISPHEPGFISQRLISPSAEIASTAIVENGVFIADHVVIEAGAIIKSGSVIRKAVTIRENTTVGVSGINFYRSLDGRVMRFPHLAGVLIDEEVEIGANAVICRGILSSTRIGKQTIIGNLSNIGHGANIGKLVWMSVGALVGGHSRIQDSATLGMGATIKDNIDIGKNASIGMGSVVVKSIADNTSAFGNPAKKMVGLKTGPAR